MAPVSYWQTKLSGESNWQQFCSHPNSAKLIATKCSTWQHSFAVYVCVVGKMIMPNAFHVVPYYHDVFVSVQF